MKKVYSTPDIVFESFSLSSSIATSCAVETNFAEGSCGYKYAPGKIIFMDRIAGCVIPVEDGSPTYNGICYDIPTDIKALFNS